MAEQSYLFDFRRVEDFIENINVAFFIDEMWWVTGLDNDGEPIYPDGATWDDAFELVIVEYGDENIKDYLTDDGLLDTTRIDGVHIMDCNLDYYNQGDGDSTFELHDTVTFNIGDANVPIKAVFLRNKSTGYVMGYSINTHAFTVTNQVVFDNDIIFWDVSRFNQ